MMIIYLKLKVKYKERPIIYILMIKIRVMNIINKKIKRNLGIILISSYKLIVNNLTKIFFIKFNYKKSENTINYFMTNIKKNKFIVY